MDGGGEAGVGHDGAAFRVQETIAGGEISPAFGEAVAGLEPGRGGPVQVGGGELEEPATPREGRVIFNAVLEERTENFHLHAEEPAWGRGRRPVRPPAELPRVGHAVKRRGRGGWGRRGNCREP